MSCQYWMEKKNRFCSFKGKEEYTKDEKLYCKRHYIMMCTDNSTDHSSAEKKKIPKIPKEPQKKVQCEYILLSKKQCALSSTSIHDEKHYCTRHYKKIQLDSICSYTNCNVIRTTSSVYCEAHFSEKEEYDEIHQLINDMKNMSLSKNRDIPNIKKKYFKILLKIHPDKCKNSMIQSHELTQTVNRIMEKIK